MKRSLTKIFYYRIIIFFLYILEFLILYHGDLPPLSPGYIQNFNSYIQTSFNPLIGGEALESNVYLMEMPLRYIFGQNNFNLILLLVYFILSTFGIYFSSKYFIEKYISYNIYYKNISLSNVIAFSIGMIYPLNFYVFGGLGFYSIFYATFPITLMILDKFIPQKKNENLFNIVLSALFIAIGMSISISDPRTIIYIFLIAIAYWLYYIILEQKKISIGNTFIVFILGVFFLMLLNLRTILDYEYLRTTGAVSILGNAASSQLGIAYQRFSPLYILSESRLWNLIYNSRIYYIGLIPICLSIFSVLKKSARNISIFFLLLILVIIFISGTSIGVDLRYYIGQTSLYSYLFLLYPTYIVSILYVPLLLIPFSLGFYFIIYRIINRIYNTNFSLKKDLLNNLPSNERFNETLKLFILFIIIILLISPIIYYDSNNIKNVNLDYKTVNVPQYVYQAENIINSNDTGIVYVLGSGNGVFNALESNLTVSPSWYSYITAYPQYLINNHLSNFSRTLALLGIQYILLYNESSSRKSYFNVQKGLKLIYSEKKINLYENAFYKPFVISHTGVYVAYDFPLVLNYIARSNISSPIIPFYEITNFSKLEPYVRGIIGVNITSKDVIPLLSTNFSYNLNDLNINQYPEGWQQLPLFWAGDTITGIVSRSSEPISIPLNNVQNGLYYIYIEGGIAATNGYYTTGSSVLNISSRSNTSIDINENNYAPVVKLFSGGTIYIKNSVIKINATVNKGLPMINELYLIPYNKYKSIATQETLIRNKINIINYSNSIKINSSNNIISGATATWYVSLPSKDVNNQSIPIEITNTSKKTVNPSGANYAISGIKNNDNGNSLFEFYPELNYSAGIVNNTRYFGSYAQNQFGKSLAYVNVSNFYYGYEKAVYLPALPKIGSVALFTNETFRNNITVNLDVMSTDWGTNPGIIMDNTLIDFSGRLNGMYPNYFPFSPKDNIWYNVYVSIGGNNISMWIFNQKSNVLVYSVHYDLKKYNLRPLESPIGIRSDNGNLYFTNLKIYNSVTANSSFSFINYSNEVQFYPRVGEYNETSNFVTLPITLSYSQKLTEKNIENTIFIANGTVLVSWLSSINSITLNESNPTYTKKNGTEEVYYSKYQFVQSSFIQPIELSQQVFKGGLYYGSSFVYISAQKNPHLLIIANISNGYTFSLYNLAVVIILLSTISFFYFRKKN